MSDPEAIRTAVLEDETMTSLIAGRLYPVVLPAVDDLDYPAITYGLVSQPMLTTQDGAQYRSPKWRFRIWSLRYAELIPVAQALAGIFGDSTRTPFPSSRIEYPSSAVEGHDKDTHLYWRALDVVVGLTPAGAGAQ